MQVYLKDRVGYEVRKFVSVLFALVLTLGLTIVTVVP